MENRPLIFQAANILADIAVMAEKSDWQQNIERYLAENPDWDYSQAGRQAFIDAALQVGEAGFGGWISGGPMGGGYSTIQNAAANTDKTSQGTEHSTKAPYDSEDIAQRLTENGLNPKKSANIAEVIAARLNGQELTAS